MGVSLGIFPDTQPFQHYLGITQAQIKFSVPSHLKNQVQPELNLSRHHHVSVSLQTLAFLSGPVKF